MKNLLCCEVNIALSCTSCGIKFCRLCHEIAAQTMDSYTHKRIFDGNSHTRFSCTTTGDEVCQEGRYYSQHVTRCTHTLEVQPQERHSLEIKENV